MPLDLFVEHFRKNILINENFLYLSSCLIQFILHSHAGLFVEVIVILKFEKERRKGLKKCGLYFKTVQ